MTRLTLPVLSTLLLASAIACADDDLESLWKDAVLWEVGSNTEKVPAARNRLIEIGDPVLDFIIPAKLDTVDGLVSRGFQTVVPGIAAKSDALRAKAVTLLSTALTHPSPNVRRSAAELLGLCGARETAPAIAKLLEVPDTRMGALSALGVLKEESAAPAIVALLDDPAVLERHRVAAASTLGAIGGPDAQAALLRALDHDLPALRFAAQYALEAMRSVGALAARLRSPKKRVALHAMSALGHIADRAVRPDLLPFRRNADPHLRGFAVEALTAMLKPSDDAWVRESLAAERDPFVRGKLEAALRKLEESSGLRR